MEAQPPIRCTILNSELVTGELIIPDGVTSIGNNAFCGYDRLTSVTIPDGVTSIGDYAFRGCDPLTSVTIPDSVTSIGYQAFAYCDSLTSVTIPDSVTSIGGEAFSWGDNLQYNEYGNALYLGNDENPYVVLIEAKNRSIASVNINASTKLINNEAFRGCESLASVTIPDSVTSIGYNVFSGCDNLQYNVYGNALYLGNDENPYVVLIEAKNKLITSVDIYDATKIIYQSAFEDCDALTSVTIGNGVTSIGDYAFRGCDSLTSVTIPDSVTSIGYQAFAYCDSLTSVTFDGTVGQWNAVDKDSDWNYKCPFTEVVCSDGVVEV